MKKPCPQKDEKLHVKIRSYMDYRPSVRSRWLDNWPSSSFVCFRSETELRSPNSFLTEQVWSKKDLLYGNRTMFSCGT